MIDFKRHRPSGYASLGDSRLPRMINELTELLIDAQDDFDYDTLRLGDKAWGHLAHVLVECAEDLHQEIGMWTTLEQYHRDFFGTPLPLTLTADNPPPETPTLKDRLAHLLWVLYAEIEPDLILSPTHQDLHRLATVAADFLETRFARVRHTSGIKQFLHQRDRYGWDIKRKLVWMGQHAYLFRYNVQNYVADHGGQADIPTIDDFICQETTAWSGLGVSDILAGVLSLNKKQRADLRQWHERHVAYYRIVRSRRNRLELLNLINNEPYSVRVDNDGGVFKKGEVVFGSLTPWAGEWYWSGGQRLLGPVSETVIQEAREKMWRSAPQIVYRYDKKRLAAAEEIVEHYRQHFVQYHGDNLTTYPDGATMAADMQKMYQQYNQSRAEAFETELETDDAPVVSSFEAAYPPELMESDNGIGVFFNPGEGTEMMIGFNDVMSGLKKRGQNLNEDEMEAIQGLIQSDAISPQFVQHLVRDTGDESIAEAFLIREGRHQPYLDYLLRRYKGHFYRARYPQITLISE